MLNLGIFTLMIEVYYYINNFVSYLLIYYLIYFLRKSYGNISKYLLLDVGY